MATEQKSVGIAGRMKRFMKDSTGNVSVFLGIAAIPMFLGLGTAIDSIRASREQTAFQAALDSAAIAVAADARSDFTGLNATDKEARRVLLESMAQKFVNQNYISSTGGISDVTVALTIDGRNVEAKASHVFPTAIMGLVGINTMTMNLSSQTKRAQVGGVELTLVMDTTGSMDWNSAGNTTNTVADKRITGAKTAALKLLEIIYGGTAAAKPTSTNIRASLVPFATAVRLKSTVTESIESAIDKTGANPISNLQGGGNNYSKWGANWNGCVEARSASLGYSTDDTAPTITNGATYFPAFYNPDYSDHSANCAVSSVVPMTYSRANLEAGISAMTASGSTLIPEGLAWGWRLISPTEPYTKVEAAGSIPQDTISPYRDSKWHKIMVLMTDGDNSLGEISTGNNGNKKYGTSYSSYGYSSEANIANNRFGKVVTSTNSGGASAEAEGILDAKVQALCTSIKNQGIELYVTGFGGTISASSLANLQACASLPTASHYTSAADNATLLSFFTQIGNNINENALYVSK